MGTRIEIRAVCAALLTLVAAACSPPSNTQGDVVQGHPDVARDANHTRCAIDLDCDDGVFCNGAERCMPGATGANAAGCIAPAGAACLPTQMCNEPAARCQSDCGRAPDADGDGHRAAECGGDDCDDADRNRFPGNAEVCDPSHDEDCVLTTVGSHDLDHDGEDAQMCCNIVPGIAPSCGRDCDDTRANVNSREAEVCDGVDNNCNGLIDEGLAVRAYYPDCDGDGSGAVSSTPMMTCAPPAAMPTCVPPSTVGTWSTTNDDCLDNDESAHVGVPELCDGVDNNCDGRIDETPAATRACGMVSNASATCASGRCMAACTAGFGDCDGAFGNGCEADLATSRTNCGACGQSCQPYETCSAGACRTTACPAGTHACAGACATNDSIDHCGFECSPCFRPTHGNAVCAGASVLACDVACDPGYLPMNQTYCVPAPVPVRPLSGALVESTFPAFTFLCPGTLNNVTIEVCSDRLCAHVVASWPFMCTGGSNTFVSDRSLPTGTLYWHVTGLTGSTPPLQQFAIRPNPPPMVPPGALPPMRPTEVVRLDVNGDGFVDALVGAPAAIGRRGEVFVYIGAATGLSTTPVATLTAPDGEPSFGTLVSLAGDLNGDSYGDVLVAASNAASNDGRCYVYYGSAAGLDTSHPTIVDSPSRGNHFGQHIAGGGDVDGDGFADIAITDGEGLYFYHGRPVGVSSSADTVVPSPDGLSTPYGSMAIGDLDSDGYSDVVVATPVPRMAGGYIGFFIVSGARRGLLPFPSEFHDVAMTPDSLGLDLAFVGDVNGDGYGDVAVTGAGQTSTAGPLLRRVRVYTGNFDMPGLSDTAVADFFAPAASDSTFGDGLGFAGDIDGDHIDDIVVGAPGTSQLFWVRGRLDLTTSPIAGPSGMITLGMPSDHGGVSLLGLGDINADGFGDLLVGADAAMASGRAYLLSGGMTGLSGTATATFMPTDATTTQFGRTLAWLRPRARRVRTL